MIVFIDVLSKCICTVIRFKLKKFRICKFGIDLNNFKFMSMVYVCIAELYSQYNNIILYLYNMHVSEAILGNPRGDVGTDLNNIL